MHIQWIVDGIQGNSLKGYKSTLASHRYRCIMPGNGLIKLGFNINYISCHDWLSYGSHNIAQAIIVAKRLPSPKNINEFIDQNAKLFEQLKIRKQQGIPIIADVNDDHFHSSHSAIANYWHTLVKLADMVITGSSTMAESVKQFSNTPTIVIEDPLESSTGEIRIFQRPSTSQALLQHLTRKRGWFNQRLQLVWYGNELNWPDLIACIPDLTFLASDLPFTLKIVTSPTPEILSFIKGYNAHNNPNAHLIFSEWKQDTVWQDIAESHIALLPSNLIDNKKSVKTANRLIEALNIGRFVVGHPVPAYQQLGDYVWLGEQLSDGIRWAIDNPQLVKQKINNGQIHIKNQFSVEVISDKWKNAIDTVIQNSTATTFINSPRTPTEVASNTITKLNLGCGDKILPDYINVDVAAARNGKQPDVLCDLANLSQFQDNSIDEILSVHVIEHFWRWEIESILNEWIRVLKPGGQMILECPNLISACERFLKNPEQVCHEDQRGQQTMWVFYGDPSWKDPLMVHRWGYTPHSLKLLLQKVGLQDVRQEPAKFKLREPRDMRIVGIKPL